MRAGRLRHRVTLRRRAVARDTYGAEIFTWNTYATIWAAIEPLQGNERTQSQQVVAEETSKVIIRFVSGVKANDRVYFGTRILDINAVINPAERNEYLELRCTEAVE